MTLRVLWGWDALISAVVLVFFVIGLGDGSISSFNIELWLVLLAGLVAVLLGSLALQSFGYHRLATLLLLVLGLPGLFYALFFVAILVSNPRWN